MLAILTLAHPLVDACSVCVAISGGLTPGRILAYNAIAFVVLASVACSAILAFFFESGSAGVWLPLVFMSQLATGPVLSALHGAVGRRSGTAFGLNCMALFVGSLP